MAFKTVLFFASALFVQCISGQNCRRISVSSCGYSTPVSSSTVSSSYGNVILPAPSCGNTVSVSNNGGSFLVTSVGPIAPSGIAVASELDLCGQLAVSGGLPFLSAVAFDGEFPTSGAASVSYGCGDGTIAITQELGNPTGNNAASSSGLSVSQLATCGCGR